MKQQPSSKKSGLAELAARSLNVHYRPQSASDALVLRQIFELGHYDPRDSFPLMAALRAYGEQLERPLILDCGANIGASSVFFADAYPKAGIVAIEPDAGNYKLLEENAAQRHNITPVHGAVSCTDETVYLTDPGLGEWGYRTQHEVTEHAVHAYSVPTLLQQYGGEPFIAKIDIEGAEASLFRRNAQWVLRFALVIIELHDWLLPGGHTSHNFLRSISVFPTFDVIPRDENVWCFNTELLPSERAM